MAGAGKCGTGSFDFTITAPDWMTLSGKQRKRADGKRILARVEDCTASREGEILVKDPFGPQRGEDPGKNRASGTGL